MPRHRRRPVDAKSSIRRLERRQRDAFGGKRPGPSPVRPEPRPACAAERQDGGACGHPDRPVRRGEKRPGPVPALPAPAGAEADAAPRQPPRPGTQQRRGLHRHRKHPPGRAGEDRLPQSPRPGLHVIRAEGGEHRREPCRRLAIGGEEAPGRFHPGQVQPRLASHQELASDRGLGLGQKDGMASPGQYLGRHHPRRPRPHDQRRDPLLLLAQTLPSFALPSG